MVEKANLPIKNSHNKISHDLRMALMLNPKFRDPIIEKKKEVTKVEEQSSEEEIDELDNYISPDFHRKMGNKV